MSTLPAATASLTVPPESNCFHSIVVSGSASSSQPSCLTTRSPLGIAWYAITILSGAPPDAAWASSPSSPHPAAAAVASARSRPSASPARFFMVRASLRESGRRGSCLAPPGDDDALDRLDDLVEQD